MYIKLDWIVFEISTSMSHFIAKGYGMTQRVTGKKLRVFHDPYLIVGGRVDRAQQLSNA